MIIHIKSVKWLCANMFERVYGGIKKCATLFPYALFEHGNEQTTTNILTVDVVLYAEIKRMSSMLK